MRRCSRALRKYENDWVESCMDFDVECVKYDTNRGRQET